MHRNTVRNIITIYNKSACSKLKQKIQNNESLSLTEINTLCCFFLPQSRKPKSHPKQANESEEKQIMDWYEKTKV
jgi:hypothetical protein